VRIAESADPEEVSSWQQRIHLLTAELEGLRQLHGMKERLDADKAEVKRQKRTLAAIAADREMAKKKLEEIYQVLDNLRLS
jgi:Tfp pilus assembly protein PilN